MNIFLSRLYPVKYCSIESTNIKNLETKNTLIGIKLILKTNFFFNVWILILQKVKLFMQLTSKCVLNMYKYMSVYL